MARNLYLHCYSRNQHAIPDMSWSVSSIRVYLLQQQSVSANMATLYTTAWTLIVRRRDVGDAPLLMVLLLQALLARAVSQACREFAAMAAGSRRLLYPM